MKDEGAQEPGGPRRVPPLHHAMAFAGTEGLALLSVQTRLSPERLIAYRIAGGVRLGRLETRSKELSVIIWTVRLLTKTLLLLCLCQ